jgi:UrcA family protein
MLRMMIFGAAALLPTGASATSSIAISDDGHEARISYGDLNLGSPAGRSTLTGRIQRAAGLLCLDAYSTDPLEVSPTRAECYRIAVTSGVDQMNAIAADRAG